MLYEVITDVQPHRLDVVDPVQLGELSVDGAEVLVRLAIGGELGGERRAAEASYNFV